MSATQSRIARAALRWRVQELARAAGVSPDTVARLERADRLADRTQGAVRVALEAAGVRLGEDGSVAPPADPLAAPGG